VDVSVALAVVPVIIGLVVLALRLGLPPLYETPAAIILGVAISIGYAVAAQVPGGTAIADAVVRGTAIGLTSAGAIATIRRLVQDDRAGRRPTNRRS
jgi:hypothetical protein